MLYEYTLTNFVCAIINLPRYHWVWAGTFKCKQKSFDNTGRTIKTYLWDQRRVFLLGLADVAELEFAEIESKE